MLIVYKSNITMNDQCTKCTKCVLSLFCISGVSVGLVDCDSCGHYRWLKLSGYGGLVPITFITGLTLSQCAAMVYSDEITIQVRAADFPRYYCSSCREKKSAWVERELS
jgi:hypothetical protein